jgi:hypothetical protein
VDHAEEVTPDDYAARVLDAFAGPAASVLPPDADTGAGNDSDDDEQAGEQER